MESLVSAFHIDLKLLIAQAVNFAIVFSVLYFFAFKPISKMMAERATKIEKSLEDARTIEAKLAEAEQEKNDIVGEAKKAASIILEEANKQGEERQKEMVAKAREEIGQVINTEKAKIQIEKAQTLKELKEETAALVVLTVEKLLKEKLDNTKDEELISKLVK